MMYLIGRTRRYILSPSARWRTEINTRGPLEMGRMRSIKHLNTLPKDRKRSRSSSRSGSRRSVSASPRRFFASTPSSGAPGFPTPKSKPQRSFTEETAIKARQREALLHVLTAPGWGSIFGGVAAVFAVVGVTSLGVGVAWDHARAAADEERLERWLMQQGGDDHRQYEWIELEPGNHRRTAGGRRAMETLAGEGRGVWARIRGEGLPVVILDGSVGETSADFYKVEELVSAFTTCVSFDRPGLGLSSLPPPPGSDNPVPDISPPVASSGAQFVPDSDTVHDLAENLEDVASAIVDRLETRSRTMGRPTVVLVGQGTVGGLAAQCYESDQCERDQRKGGRRLSEDKCSPGGKVPPRVVGVVYLDPVVPGVQQEQEAAVPAVAAAVEQQRNNAEWTARLVPTGITRLFGSTAAAHAQLLCDIPDHWPPQNKVNDSKRGIGDGMAEEELRIRTAEQRSGCKETNAKENGSRNPSERGRRERREPEDRPTLSTAAALRDTVEATRSRKRHRQTVAAELNMYLDGAKHLGSIPLALGGDNGGGDARDNIVPPPAIVLSHGRAVFEGLSGGCTDAALLLERIWDQHQTRLSRETLCVTGGPSRSGGDVETKGIPRMLAVHFAIPGCGPRVAQNRPLTVAAAVRLLVDAARVRGLQREVPGDGSLQGWRTEQLSGERESAHGWLESLRKSAEDEQRTLVGQAVK